MTKHLPLMFVVALLALLHSHAQTQPDSRRLQLDEAEQLALQAQSLGYKSERMRYRNETAATEVHAEAIKAMSRAISIWEQLEVPSLVGAGLTELSRLQISFGDVDAALASSRRQIDYWHARGDLQREGEACSELSARLWAGRRNAEALAMLEQTIAFAQANHLSDLYANELSMKAIYLKAMGRNPEADVAEQMAAKANLERLGSMHQAVAEPEARMPDRWLDVQAAPLFAELRVVDGKLRLVLVNRSARAIATTSLGCASEENGKWKLSKPLFSMSMNHGGVRPDGYFDVTRAFAGTRNWWTDRPMGCEQGRPTVVEVLFADGTKWQLPG